jgi:hypothetical protein
LIAATLSFVGCASAPTATNTPAGRAFAEANPLFHQDPRWLGADAALSTPLAPGRTLWLFGDTFIALSDKHVRTESTMVHNTVAIQTGDDPRTAAMVFSWRTNADSPPDAFFPERGSHYFWPGCGIRLSEGPLVVFLYDIVNTNGEQFGFKCTGYALALVDNPDAPAAAGEPRIVPVATSAFDAVPATALVREGDYVVALAIRENGTHAGALVRYPAAALAQGDVSHAEWWAGNARGWVSASALGANGPTFVLDDAGAECSIHWDARTKSYIHIASYGFGATTIGMRTAPNLTGPWSEPVTVYRPPESDGPHPFVYAAKAHPELIGPHPDDLVLTYATNSFTFGDLFTPEGERSLYWPQFVVVKVGK